MATGGDVTGLRARPAAVFFVLIRQSPLLAILAAVPGLVAFFEGALDLMWSLAIPCSIALAVACWSWKSKIPDDLRRIEGIVAFAAVFLIAIFLTLPAFLVLGMSPMAALFEATSGITTTGLSVAADTSEWPISAHVLRAWLQWCGGLAIAVGGSALLMNPGRAARALAEPAIGDRDFHQSARGQARLVLLVYTLITLAALPLSVLLFPGYWEGPVVVLAAISTGGFAPRPDSLASYDVAAQAFVIGLCTLGALPLLLYAILARGAWAKRLGELPPLRPVCFALIGGLLCASIANLMRAAPLPLWDVIFMQLSAQTTAGFSTVPIDPGSPSMVPFLVGMVVGAAVGSTGGGLKAGRAAQLFGLVGQTLRQMRQPGRAIAAEKGTNAASRLSAATFASGLLVCYIATVAVVWGALIATGAPILPSFFDAISAVSCVGLGTGIVGADLPGWTMGVVSLGMILGRLEFFALIALILPATWR